MARVWGQEAIRGHIHLVRNTPYGKKIENKLNRGAGRPGPAPGALPSWLARGGGGGAWCYCPSPVAQILQSF